MRWLDGRAVRSVGVALLLVACSAEPDAPGAIPADEERRLNEAAAMLDANSVDADALADPVINQPATDQEADR